MDADDSWFRIASSLLNACVLQKKGINMLFVLGGNGTHAGALAIHNEVKVYHIFSSTLCLSP